MSPPYILHLHASFAARGAALRAVRLMNAWGPRARHLIVSGDPEEVGARRAIAPDVSYELAQDPPPLAGRPSVARFEALARLSRGFDLVLSHGWGAIDGVMARRAFGKDAPPVIHHEDGFDTDEADGPRIDRNLYRRIALSAAHALVVPGRALEELALRTWAQPAARVHRIANGIDASLYAGGAAADAIPGLKRRKGEVVVGTVAGLRAVKDLPALVRATGGVSAAVRLVIVGEGPERDAIRRAGAAMGMEDRLVLPGHLDHPHRWIGRFDVLAMSSLTEQCPTAVLEGMAAELPVAALPVGDVAEMVSAENRPYVAQARDPLFLRDSIQTFAAHPEFGRHVGAANRQRVAAEFSEAAMIARYAALYEGALGHPGALTG